MLLRAMKVGILLSGQNKSHTSKPAATTDAAFAPATIPNAINPSPTSLCRSAIAGRTNIGVCSRDQLYQLIYKISQAADTLYRDFPWRNTTDPYAIWISEVMLQQTQTARVALRWQEWLEQFPTVDVLAQAQTADVLRAWQGMGYNRRALYVLKTAQIISAHGGVFPQTTAELVQLPGIGAATAAGICAFAWNRHCAYLETNVRSVLLHELFPHEDQVSDRELITFVDALCPDDAPRTSRALHTPRMWNYALLDYGVWLKQHVSNPSRRSRSYTKQSKFEGSHRQKRAALVRILLDSRAANDSHAMTTARACELLCDEEVRAGRSPVSEDYVEQLLCELRAQDFCTFCDGSWQV